MNASLQKFGIKFKNFFGSKKKESKGNTREFIAKLSRGLMLPIAMLPVAGIFLGVGSAIANNANNDQGLLLFGNFLKVPGDVIFGALPVLFAIAIAIAFTKDAGPAALSALIGFLVFAGLQMALIDPVTVKVVTNATTGAYESQTVGYNLLFYGPGSLGTTGSYVWSGQVWEDGNIVAKTINFGLPTSLFGTVLGINQLQTSVFGGFIVGFLVAFLYNKFKNIQLPQVIGFFNGVRFIPIVTFATLFPVTLLVLILWPLVGTLFTIIGGALGGNMYGFNSFIFGYIERSLVPFGLHHAFYSPLWYSNVGGQLDLSVAAVTSSGVALSLDGTNAATWGQIAQYFGYKDSITASIGGDQVLWAFANSNLVGKTVQVLNGSGATHTISFSDLSAVQGIPGLGQASGATGVNIGQYLQGKYPFMMFGLPAAAIAMVMAAPKENRKMAASIVLSAGFTAMLTGITEPIEFTFLFLAPWLFWGVHAFFCALSFGLMNWVGLIAAAAGHQELAPHIGMSFSGGLIDWVIYGGIQIQYGSNAWWSLLIGLVYAPIYYFLFLILIKKFNVQTPGRGENTKLFTKQDFLNKNKGNESSNNQALNLNMTQDRALAIEVIKAYGGLDNIKNVDACITKLRIQVANQDIVNGDRLTGELGARGVIKPSKQSVYAIYGAQADRIKNEINEIIDNIHDNPQLKDAYFNTDNKTENQPTATTTPTATVANDVNVSDEKVIVKAPMDGTIVPITEVPDATFSQMMLGNGVAIQPKNGSVTSPISGKLSLVFDTGHAYTFESKKGTQILIHIGIDSINLKDKDEKELKPFTPKVKTGDSVKMGDDIASFKLANLKEYAKSTITPIIVLNESLNGREVKILKTSGKVEKGEPLFEISAPKANKK